MSGNVIKIIKLVGNLIYTSRKTVRTPLSIGTMLIAFGIPVSSFPKLDLNYCMTVKIIKFPVTAE
jgi:hypothetical protein